MTLWGQKGLWPGGGEASEADSKTKSKAVRGDQKDLEKYPRISLTNLCTSSFQKERLG